MEKWKRRGASDAGVTAESLNSPWTLSSTSWSNFQRGKKISLKLYFSSPWRSHCKYWAVLFAPLCSSPETCAEGSAAANRSVSSMWERSLKAGPASVADWIKKCYQSKSKKWILSCFTQQPFWFASVFLFFFKALCVFFCAISFTFKPHLVKAWQ